MSESLPDDAAASPRASTEMPDSPPSPTMLLVLQGRMMGDLVDARLAEIGLTLRQFGFLGHLARTPGLSFTELAARARITVQSAHTIIGRLAADGLVDAVDSTRGRAATLTLTGTGRERLEQADAIVREIDRERFDDATTPAWTELGAALRATAPPPFR
jgi:DNA-binding MarR family transcriptional regulator